MDFNATWALTKKKIVKELKETKDDAIRLIRFLRSCDHDHNGGAGYQFIRRLFHLPILGWKLKTDILIKPKWATSEGSENAYTIKETWVKDNVRDLAGTGYVRCYGLHDNILWWGVRNYIKIHGGEVADNRGNLQTATTLNNSMKSNAVKSFRRAMARGALPTMDLQKIGLLLLIGGGAILGMYLMGWI